MFGIMTQAPASTRPGKPGKPGRRLLAAGAVLLLGVGGYLFSKIQL